MDKKETQEHHDQTYTSCFHPGLKNFLTASTKKRADINILPNTSTICIYFFSIISFSSSYSSQLQFFNTANLSLANSIRPVLT